MTSFNSPQPQYPPGAMQGQAPMYPGMVPPEKKRRKKEKKVRFREKSLDISINSLLDVLSVILVFLMKSYSTTTVQIKPSRDLQVPFSWSSGIVEDTTSITLTLKDILLDDKPVLRIENGKVGEQDLSSGGLLIEPLFAKLQEEVAHLKKIESRNTNAKFKGIVTIIADRYVPFPLLAQVMYTAGQAEFGSFKFALIRSDR